MRLIARRMLSSHENVRAPARSPVCFLAHWHPFSFANAILFALQSELTYMLIPEEVRRAFRDGKLQPFKSPLPWAEAPRAFLMTAHLERQINEGLASQVDTVHARWEKLQADISHFVEGGYINWGLMKWLDPHKFEHWELKSVRPRPSLRVLGRFACPDVFVGTHVLARTELKGKWDITWELQKLECEDHWKAALGDTSPYHAAAYEQYITENAGRDIMVAS